VDGLRLDQADADTKGDLFEHVLRQIKRLVNWASSARRATSSAPSSRWSTPRLAKPSTTRRQARQAFLVAAYNHIRLANSSPAWHIQTVDIDGKLQRRGPRRQALGRASDAPCKAATFFGNDVDPKMVRLATMNLTLRGLPNVRILLRNALTTTLDATSASASWACPKTGFHVVLANPPFSGRVDKDRISR
jgi:type I restriction enzyme M protein